MKNIPTLRRVSLPRDFIGVGGGGGGGIGGGTRELSIKPFA
ncbi:MAG: hypothetical protein NVV59_12355 [Chitinophagaceae bacterium]|nr:hypothetical protein [Chitinophagaceae bacterium]